MPLFPEPLAGLIEEHTIDSSLLRENILGDPHVRPLWVYTPPGYDPGSERMYPTIYLLQGFTGTLQDWCTHSPFRQNVPQLVDGLFRRGDAPPAILVFVDAWTSYGGSQFIDSTGTGRYHSYLCEEIVPWVDQEYRTIQDCAHRAITGKSSGGFGAMATAMLRPDLFGAFATHSGDAHYEAQYIPAFLQAARMLRAYDGSIEKWWEDFRGRRAFTKGEDMRLLEVLGISACFSPGPDGRPLLPFDTSTGQILPEVWERWLRWDPVRMVGQYCEALHSQKGMWIDAGTYDEWHLDLGAKAFRNELKRIEVPDHRIHFELFGGGHFGIEHRQPMSVKWLAELLSPEE
ncbi:alpha/beta hydrolase-fold protein [Kitasatospora sp. NPDC059747]|uniref:alpha/beta hydrolase n=1 Tax=Kitasatospora sp. NPDC059747 TaxID=3346930 RepID=UPI003648709A